MDSTRTRHVQAERLREEAVMERRTRVLLSVAAAITTLGPLTALAPPASASHQSAGIWSHAANACTVDEVDVAEYAVDLRALSHRPGVVGTVTARCNVENLPLVLGGDTPALELVYRDPDGPGTAYSVFARLRAVARNGSVLTIATASSNTAAASTSYRSVFQPFSHDFNFRNNAYYVEITVFRSNLSQAPAAALVRLVGIVG